VLDVMSDPMHVRSIRSRPEGYSRDAGSWKKPRAGGIVARHRDLSRRVPGGGLYPVLIALVLLSMLFGGAVYAAERPAVGEPVRVVVPQDEGDGMLQQLLAELDAAWTRQDWAEALRLIDLIIAIDPEYPGIQDRQYQAHISYGYQSLTDGQCAMSLQQFQLALMLRPDGQEALVGLELLNRYCPTPQTPTSVPPTPTVTVAPTYPVTVVPTTHAGPGLSSPITHVVQTGDTLYSLARRYGTTVEAIMQANGLLTYNIRIGDVLWIPAGFPPPGPIVHIVQPGETLFSIARKYNTTVAAIMAANNLKTTTIYAYSVLCIPSAVHPGPIIHIVQPGETLFSISKKYHVTVHALMAANGLSTTHIFVCQRLVIPPVDWTGWPLVPAPHVPSYPGRVHVVKKGDTLFSISRCYGTTVHAIMQANGLVNTNIRVGQTLYIP